MKKALTLALAAFLVGLPLPAQEGKIDTRHFDKLSNKANQYAEVTLKGLPLKLALKMVAKEDPEEYEVLKHIKGIYVRVFDLEKNSFTKEDVEAIRRQISAPPWESLVVVKDRSDRDVQISVLADPKTETLKGLVVLAMQGGQLAFVNIVGDFDPEKLDLLEGNFGIPSTVNLGGTKKAKKDEQRKEEEN